MFVLFVVCCFIFRYIEKLEFGCDVCWYSKMNYCCGRVGFVFFFNISVWFLVKGYVKFIECLSFLGICNCLVIVSEVGFWF